MSNEDHFVERYYQLARALLQTEDGWGVAEVIASDEVTTTDEFHRYLLEFRNQVAVPNRLTEFPNWDEFFTQILNISLRDGLLATKPSAQHRSVAKQHVPKFYEEILSALDGKVPGHTRRRHSSDTEGIRSDIASTLGCSPSELSISHEAEIPGLRTALVRVECLACKEPWLRCNSYVIDLFQRPELAPALRAGSINNDACPICHVPEAIPREIWVADDPIRDVYFALTATARINPDLTIVRLPHGSPKGDPIGVKYGALAVFLKPHADWINDFDTLRFAASNTEFLEELSKAQAATPAQILLEQLHLMFRSGALLHEIELHTRQIPASEFDNIHMYSTPTAGMTEVEIVLQSLLNEAMFRAHDSGPTRRAMASAEVCRAYIKVGKNGLARAAAMRAVDNIEKARTQLQDSKDVDQSFFDRTDEAVTQTLEVLAQTVRLPNDPWFSQRVAQDFDHRLSVNDWSLAEMIGAKELDAGDCEAALAWGTHGLAAWFETAVENATELIPHLPVPLSELSLRAGIGLGDESRAISLVEAAKHPILSAAVSFGIPQSRLNDDTLRALEESLYNQIDSSEPEATTAHINELRESLANQRSKSWLMDESFLPILDSNVRTYGDTKVMRQRLASFGPNTTFLGTLVSEDAIWSYLVNSETASIAHGPRIELGPNTDRQMLSATILQPHEQILEQMAPDDLLVISPHDELYRVAFANLPLHGRPLCESVELAFCHGLGGLRPSRPKSKRATSLLALGGDTRPDLGSIPWADIELERITSSATNCGLSSQILLDDDRPAIEALSEVDLVHFACHATGGDATNPAALFLKPRSPENSGVLSDTNIIDRLRLDKRPFVNLAGCKTAVQTDGRGPLLGGLVPAFLTAGAQAVMASQRDINDEFAPQFFAPFYKRLFDGQRPSSALALTQRSCIAGELGDELKDPDLWAGYQVFGT